MHLFFRFLPTKITTHRADTDMQFSKKEIAPNASDLNLYNSGSGNQSSHGSRFLLGEYKLDNLRCGTKFEIYMTASKSFFSDSKL